MSRRTVEVKGNLWAKTAYTENIAETLTTGLKTFGLDNIATVRNQDGEVGIEFIYVGESNSRMNTTNFAFGEKVAGLAQEALKQLNINLIGNVALHSDLLNGKQTISVSDGVTKLSKGVKWPEGEWEWLDKDTVVRPDTRSYAS